MLPNVQMPGSLPLLVDSVMSGRLMDSMDMERCPIFASILHVTVPNMTMDFLVAGTCMTT
jgi:hypothetical protein